MALIPLNTFKTKTQVMNTSTTATMYTAPIGVTSIVLMAQIANLSSSTQSISFIHHRNRPVLADAQGFGAQPGNTDSYLVREFAVPSGDAASVLSGKMILESLDSIRAYIHGNEFNSGTCQLILSVLETANN